MKQAREKYDKLLAELKTYGRVAVAFSAGVDSTLLLHAALDALGRENVLAITGRLVAFPDREGREAAAFCLERGVRHAVTAFDQFAVEGFRNNPPDRCYRCKKALFTEFLKTAEKEGFSVLAEGTNGDDPKEYRPGMRALFELGIKSPLRDAGLSKAEIRGLSREFGLPTATKPSLPCLATRFPYGEFLSAEKIAAVDEGERFLLSLGFSRVRVRCHGDIARIEVEKDMLETIAGAAREEIIRRFRALGFLYVTVDLEGFQSGSMDKRITEND